MPFISSDSFILIGASVDLKIAFSTSLIYPFLLLFLLLEDLQEFPEFPDAVEEVSDFDFLTEPKADFWENCEEQEPILLDVIEGLAGPRLSIANVTDLTGRVALGVEQICLPEFVSEIWSNIGKAAEAQLFNESSDDFLEIDDDLPINGSIEPAWI